MSINMLDEVNAKIKQEILREREVRLTSQDSYLSVIPKNLRFHAFSEHYHIKELISLCKENYHNLVFALIMKEKRENIKGYQIIERFRTRPFIFISLLSLHPENKVKIFGKTRFVAIKLLMKNPKLLDVATKLYRKYKR